MEYNEKLDRTVESFKDFMDSVTGHTRSKGVEAKNSKTVGNVGMSMRKAIKKAEPITSGGYIEDGNIVDLIQGGYIRTDHVANLTPKHKWTKEQMREARAISYRLLVGNPSPENHGWNHLFYPRISINRTTGETNASVGARNMVRAKCQPNDEYNYDIGIMVALCKLYGRRLPDWIHGKVVD